MQTIFCCIPMKNGTKIMEEVWGMLKQAREITNKETKIMGIIIHCAETPEHHWELPFDEIWHVKLTEQEWRNPYFHVDVWQKFRKQLKTSHIEKEVYFFYANPFYQEIAVRLSYRLNGTILTNAMKLTHRDRLVVIKREIYEGKACEFLSASKENLCITFSPEHLYAEKGEGTPCKAEEFLYSSTNKDFPIQFLESIKLTWKEIQLSEAQCVIGIGRGVYKTNAMDIIIELANLLNAPIGGSKVADELGLIPREKRIGSSGISIEHTDIYIAIGISGSSQHLEGIKRVKHVIAINSDPAAPIFGRCDIGIVGKYEEAIPMIIDALHEEDGWKANDEHHRISQTRI